MQTQLSSLAGCSPVGEKTIFKVLKWTATISFSIGIIKVNDGTIIFDYWYHVILINNNTM